MTSSYMQRRAAETTDAILDAIRERGTRNFTGPELAEELGLCRQTVYKHIRALRQRGHRIQADVAFGFMAQLKREEE